MAKTGLGNELEGNTLSRRVAALEERVFGKDYVPGKSGPVVMIAAPEPAPILLQSPPTKKEEYTSVEQKMLESKIGYFAKGAYGIVASAFRIPTAIRKCMNKQDICSRIDAKSDCTFIRRSQGSAVVYGGLAAMAAVGIPGVWHFLDELNAGRYGHAIALGATLAITNTVSGIYEVYRAQGKAK
ncbi:MAG: hypothetical protein WCK90_02950 [archaeon]